MMGDWAFRVVTAMAKNHQALNVKSCLTLQLSAIYLKHICTHSFTFSVFIKYCSGNCCWWAIIVIGVVLWCRWHFSRENVRLVCQHVAVPIQSISQQCNRLMTILAVRQKYFGKKISHRTVPLVRYVLLEQKSKTCLNKFMNPAHVQVLVRVDSLCAEGCNDEGKYHWRQWWYFCLM